MRRLAFLFGLALLGACSTTLEDMVPASVSPSAVPSGATGKAPRFGDSNPHDWQGAAPWHYAVPDVGRLGAGQSVRHLIRLHQGDGRRRPGRRLFS
jgi:hypothetical protein